MGLVLLIALLNIVSIFVLYSATHANSSISTNYLLIKQVIWILLGWGIFFLIAKIHYTTFRKWAYFFYWINVGLQIYTLFYGKVIYGSKRWIDFGLFHFQPSETMKLALIIVIAKVLYEIKSFTHILDFRHLVKPLFLILIPVLLTVKQPDLGTALIILAVGLSMLSFFGLTAKIIIASGLSIIIATPLLWHFALKNYQKKRIISFIQPYKDPQGIGYNSIQSQIAVGSGQLFGKGPFKGTQSQLQFIPEQHSDFIFSVFSEESGFVGGVLLLIAFFAIFFYALQSATMSTDLFASLCVVGVVIFLFWQVFVNIGMVTGVLPIVGTSLPLFSYGGSSVITTMASLGVVSSVYYHNKMF